MLRLLFSIQYVFDTQSLGCAQRNMNFYFAIACLLASVNADGVLDPGVLGGLVYAPGHASSDYYTYPRYAFEYAVKDPHTGDNKAQWEKRDGDVVKGAYSLVEPDGSLRVVEYWADDKSGFNAVVKRLGPNLHPTTVHAAPIYKAPIPVLRQGPIVSPISIGPVAHLGHLAEAPLISGPVHGAVSTQSLIKAPLPIVKNIVPAAPIHPEPIVHDLPAPIVKSAPILSELLFRAGPIYSELVGPAPVYKAPLPVYKEWQPVYKAPLPIYKEWQPMPLLKAPGGGPIRALDLIGKGPIGPWGGVAEGPIGPWKVIDGNVDDLGLVKGPAPLISDYEYLEKNPGGPTWFGALEYPLVGGLKH